MTIERYKEMFLDESITIILTVLGVRPVDVTGWVTESSQRYNADKFAQLNGLGELSGTEPLVSVMALNKNGQDFLAYGATVNGWTVRPFGYNVPASFFDTGWDVTWDEKLAWLPVSATYEGGEERLKVIRVILQKAY